jgi:uncharacterized protein YpiB (UPF0302 family)
MTDMLSVLNLVLCIGLAVGGVAAFRHGFTRTANEVQERVIHALESEIGSLKDRLSEIEKENTRLGEIIATIRTAMKRRGLLVTIDGELVSIRDESGHFTQDARIVRRMKREEER